MSTHGDYSFWTSDLGVWSRERWATFQGGGWRCWEWNRILVSDRKTNQGAPCAPVPRAIEVKTLWLLSLQISLCRRKPSSRGSKSLAEVAGPVDSDAGTHALHPGKCGHVYSSTEACGARCCPRLLAGPPTTSTNPKRQSLGRPPVA